LVETDWAVVGDVGGDGRGAFGVDDEVDVARVGACGWEWDHGVSVEDGVMRAC